MNINIMAFLKTGIMMSNFEILFGVAPEQVRKNCILMPLLPKGFLKQIGIGKLNKGKLYSAWSQDNWTLIQTGMSAPLVGDAVLYLKETPCQNMILFGSCGAVSNQKLSIGSLVCPIKCLAVESFSDFLQGQIDFKKYYPNQKLLERFLKEDTAILKTSCATMSSLKLEEDRHEWLIQQKIDVVDMECSAFFSAAQYAHFSALAIFYVADIIKDRPFYKEKSMSECDMGLAMKQIIKILNNFAF